LRTNIIIIFLLLNFQAFPQLSLDKTFHDFGEINKGDIRYADFKIINSSSKTIYILRADQDRELSIKFSKKTIEPDSSAFIRIQYNPKETGVFNKKTPLYISSENNPVILSIKGEVKYLEQNPLTDCPDFNYNKDENPIQFDVNVKVVDTLTGMPVPNASVLLLKSGVPYKAIYTNENGNSESIIQIGLYYIVTEANGYETKEVSIYLNRKHNNMTIYLHPLPELLLVADTHKIKTSNPQIIQSINSSSLLKDSIKPISNPIQPVLVKLTDSILFAPLSIDEYAPNNIVFLIDVSTSMLNQGRLDLLKASMIQLLQPLRSIDKISIITYASSVNLAMPATLASDKENISALIQGLEGGGLTAGDKGINKAYEVCRQALIAEGNNQIILATDGVFKIDQATKGLIKTSSENGIIISVVGIKNSDTAAESMQSIAEHGKGHYIQINNYNDAKRKLIEEVRTNSLRK
jgi:Ca-activated chloride channel family protein